jgi:hypothetical protein
MPRDHAEELQARWAKEVARSKDWA